MSVVSRLLVLAGLAASMNPVWAQSPTVSETPAPQGDPSARITLARNPSLPHAFDVEVRASGPVELVSVRINGDGGIWGRFSLIVEPAQSDVSFQTASFRFLPSSYTVEVEVDCGGSPLSRVFGPYSNPIQKLIVLDRDAHPQRALMIEGDRWFLFGRIVGSAEVSSGLSKNGGTPLGYYHVRKKEPFAVNAKEEWDMPYAQWYTPVEYPEGVNGLHQGFEGTIYGIRQSHGCTRMPPWFATRIWAWSEIDTPLAYIGNEYQTAYDRGRFNLGDYRFFQTLIRDTLLYQQNLLAGQETPTCFSHPEEKLVSTMASFQDEILEACAQFRRFAKGEAFDQIVNELVTERKSR